MSSGFLLRGVAFVAVLLLMAVPAQARVSASENMPVFAFQDFNDDDGDGIPNEADPDYDNDGIANQDDESPLPGTDSPEEPGGSETPVDVAEPSTPVDSAPQQPQVAAVTSLPDTGVGKHYSDLLILAVVHLILVAAWAATLRFNQR